MSEEKIKLAIQERYDDMAQKGGWISWEEYSRRSLESLLLCIETYGFDKKDNVIAIDVGGGAGRYPAFLELKYHWEIISCDFSMKLCLSGRKPHPKVSFVCADAVKLPLKDNCADIIISIGLVECLHNPADMLLEIHRVLKPEGIAIIRVINKQSMSGILEIILNKTGRTLWSCYPGFYMYTIHSMKKITSNFGEVEFYGCRFLDRYWIKGLEVFEPIVMLLERKLRKFAFAYDSYFLIIKNQDTEGGVL